MADLYFDNDVSVHLAAILRSVGHTVTLTRDLRRTRAFDEQQLVTALELGTSLVTHNYRDFLLLHRAGSCGGPAGRVRSYTPAFWYCRRALPSYSRII